MLLGGLSTGLSDGLADGALVTCGALVGASFVGDGSDGVSRDGNTPSLDLYWKTVEAVPTIGIFVIGTPPIRPLVHDLYFPPSS